MYDVRTTYQRKTTILRAHTTADKTRAHIARRHTIIIHTSINKHTRARTFERMCKRSFSRRLPVGVVVV